MTPNQIELLFILAATLACLHLYGGEIGKYAISPLNAPGWYWLIFVTPQQPEQHEFLIGLFILYILFHGLVTRPLVNMWKKMISVDY